MSNQQEKHPLTKEVNQLTFALGEIDDFNMRYKNVSCEITDESKDRAALYLDGEEIASYVYGGPWVWVLEAQEEGILKALEIVKESPYCPKEL